MNNTDKNLLGTKDKAPHWINALADSLIKVAAAISIVVSSLSIHFKPDPVEQAIKHTSKMMITLKGLLSERDHTPKAACDFSKLDSRFKKLELNSHSPRKK
jgi:hypothetical protein